MILLFLFCFFNSSINQQKSSVIFGLPEDSSSYITYHSQIDQHCFLITLGKSGTIGLVDTRVSNNSATSNYKIFEKASPKTVSVHPVQTEYFLSPNNKGACGIFDRRMNKSSKVMTPVASLIGMKNFFRKCCAISRNF